MKAHPQFKFRLYVSGEAPNSILATENLSALCKAHLPDRHHIEVVDVFRHPDRALADGIYATPMLIKLTPTPVRRVVGTLSNLSSVLLAFGLVPAAG